MRKILCGSGLLLIAGMAAVGVRADETSTPFAPFEHMVGGWKGAATPATNKVRGWTETHLWAWKFDHGKPVAMTFDWQGDKTLSKGQLRFDEASRKYHLDGTDPAGKPVAFAGSLSADGKTLTLDRVAAAKADARERIILRPNGNKIRYVLQVDRQEPGAPQYKKQIEVGLTKAGESFAAGGGENLPKCIMTGGAATMTVSYQGKTYPVCCTGCRDEFNDNPEKYARKADEAAKGKPTDAKGQPKPAAGKDDGSFDGLFDDTKPKPKSKPKPGI